MKNFYKKLILLLFLITATTFGAFSQVCFFQGFESGSIPSGWTQEPSNAAIPWSVGNSGVGNVTPQNGNYFLKLYSENSQVPIKIITPFINFSSLNVPIIEFNMASPKFAAFGGATTLGRDILKVYIRTSSNEDWIPARTITINNDGWVKQPASPTNPATAIRIKALLPSEYEGDTVQIAFEWNFTNGKGIALDDITVKEEPICTTPNGLQASLITGVSAQLNWNANAASQKYYLKVSRTPITAANLANPNVTANVYDGIVTAKPHVVTGLIPNTQYYWYVKAICSEEYNDISGWSAQGTFKTGCGALQLPFIENFSSYSTSATTTWFNSCWTRYTGADAYTSGSTVYPYVSSSNGQSLYFTHSATAITAAFLPQLDANGQDLLLQFDAAMSVGEILDVVVATDPQNQSTWTIISTFNNGTGTSASNMLPYEVEISDYATGENIGFRVRGAGSYYVYLDNIHVDIVPGCQKPSNLKATLISNSANVTTGANITWNARQANKWQVVWGETGFDPAQRTPTVVNNVPSFPINGGLEMGVEYEVYVSAICPDGYMYSEPKKLTFKVPYISPLPFETDFEYGPDNDYWEIRNATGTNVAGWYTGNASNASNGGTKSLYVSNNGGSSNNYSTTIASYSYAYRTLNLTRGKYEISFDWKCSGRTPSSDYLRVFLVPANFELVGGNAYGMNITTNIQTPPGWIPVSGFLNNSPSIWQQFYGEIGIEENLAGLYNLVFFWANSTGSTANNPPAAVDNINFSRIKCPPVYDFSVSNITTTDARVAWKAFETGNFEVKTYTYNFNPNTSGFPPAPWTRQVSSNYISYNDLLLPNTMYYVYVRELCANGFESEWNTIPFIFGTLCDPISVLPYTEDFSAYSSGEMPKPRCWNNSIYEVGNVPAGNYQPYVAEVDDNFALKVSTYYASVSGVDVYNMIYATLPKFAPNLNDLQITFSAKTSEVGKKIQVGVLEYPDDYSGFEFIAEYTIESTDWNVFTTPFGAYQGDGKYIAFQVDGQANKAITVYIDNIIVDSIQACQAPTNLKVNNISYDSVTIVWDDLVGGNNDFEVLVSTVDVGRNMALLNTLSQNQIIADVVVEDANQARVGGLQSLTTYYYYVRMVCGNEVSNWHYTSKSFKTACGPVLLPYAQEFNDEVSATSTMTECWKTASTTTTTTLPSLSTTQRYGNSGAALYMQSASSNNTFAVTPILNISSFSNKQVSFMVYTASANKNSVIVGVMTDPLNAATFTVVDTVLIAAGETNKWEEKIVNLSSYTGTGRYVAFKSTSARNYYIDNVLIETVPTCPRPIKVTVPAATITGETAKINWTKGGTETAWAVQYQKEGTVEWSIPVSVDTNFYTITNLDPLTKYNVRVKAVCIAGTDESAWSISANFKTACGVVVVPYMEGFEGYTGTTYSSAGPEPDCWYTYAQSNNAIYKPHVTSSGSYNYPHSGTNALTFTGGSSYGGTVLYAVLPVVSKPIAQLGISFWYRHESSTEGSLSVGYITGSQNNVSSFVPLFNPSPTTTLTEVDYKFSSAGVDLSNATYIAMRWTYTGTSYYSVGIDDVIVYSTSCLRPTELTLNNATTSELEISWGASDAAAKWVVEYKKVSETNWRTINNITAHSYIISGLSASTSYDVRVKAVCVEGSDESAWTVANFRTLSCNDGVDAQVGNGTTTQYYVPVYSSSSYASNYTQTVYLADNIIEESGEVGSIKSIAYKWNGTGNLTNANVWTIYIGQTSKTEFTSTTDWIPLSNLQQVYSGQVSLPASEGWVDIPLNTPFVWDGSSNIVVAVHENVSGGGTTAYWYSTTPSPTSYRTLYYYSSTNPNPSSPPTASGRGTSYPNIRFELCGVSASTCPRPTAFVANNITGSGAALSWTAGGTETEWVVEYKTSNSTNWTIIDTVTTTSYNLNTLFANTSYNVRVKAVCGEEDESRYISVNFRTLCGTTTLPFEETFNTDFTFDCWKRYDGTTISTSVPSLNTSNYSSAVGNSPSGSAYMYFGSSNDRMAVLPPFADDINTMQISFWAIMENSNTGTLQVGYLTNIDNASTFVVVSTFNTVNATWREYEVLFSTVPAGIKNIAFKIAGGQSNYYYWIDDINVYTVTNCSTPTALAVNNVTGSGATLSWTAGSTETGWVVEYKAANSSNWIINNVTGTSYPLSGLSTNTSYNVRVKAVCGGEESRYVTANFSTPCGSTVALPYTDGFESYAGTTYDAVGPVPGCWYTYAQSGSAIYKPHITGGGLYSYPHGGTNALTFTGGSATSYGGPNTYAVLPLFDKPVAQLGISFWYKQESASVGYGTFSVGYITGSQDNIASYTPLFYPTPTTTLTQVEYLFADAGINLSNATHIAIRWNYPGSTYYSAGIDDIIVSSIPCPSPVALSVNNVTTSDAEISWGAGNVEDKWVFEYKKASDPNWTIINNVTDSTYTLNGLSANTSYDVRVKAVCSATEVSRYLNLTFKTPCNALTLPFTENFSDWTTGQTYFDDCWRKYAGADANGAFPYVNPLSSNNALYYNNSVTTNVNAAFLPAIDAVGQTLLIEFDLAMAVAGRMEVITATDPQDKDTWVLIGNVINDGASATAANYKHYERILPNYQAGTYIGFKYYGTSTSTAAYLDNIVINELLDDDVTALSVTSSVGVAGMNLTTANFTVTVKNIGINAQTNVPVKLEVDGVLAGTEVIASIASRATTTVTFSNIDVSTAEHKYFVRAYTDLSTDQKRANDTTNVITVNHVVICDDALNVQVGNGAVAHAIITAYNYNYAQNIYLSDEIDLNNGGVGPITSIAFQFNSGTLNATNNVWTVYMGHTSKTEFASNTDWVPIGNLQQVFKDTLTAPAAGSWMTLNLASPFVWDGVNNIVVAILENETNNTGNVNFNGTTAANRNIYYRVTGTTPISPTTPPSGTRGTSYPNIKFNMCPSTCSRPTALAVSNIDIFEADLSWKAGGTENKWVVEYKKASDTEWSIINNIMDTTYTLEDLYANTPYNVRVKAVCAVGDESRYCNANFRTLCDAAALPFTENFSGWTTGASYFDPCWKKYAGTDANGSYPYVSSALSSNNALNYSNSTTSHVNAAFLPLMDANGLNLMIDFDLAMATAGRMEVITATNPQDKNTWVLVGSIISDGAGATAANYKHYERSLMNYQAGTYIGFKHYGTASGSAYLDNVVVSELYSNDMAAISVTSLIGEMGMDLTTADFAVTVKNMGAAQQTNVPVKLEVDGVVVATQTISSIASRATAPVINFNDIDVSIVEHTYKIRAFTDLPADQYRRNDTTGIITLTNISACSDAGDVQVGNGATTQSYVPMYNYFHFNYSQAIYLASDIAANNGGAGPITSIGYHWSGTGNLTNANTWTIYIGHTPKTTFGSDTDWVPFGSLQQVYSGPVTLPASAGWMNIVLSNPFIWDGVSNIVVAVDENVPSYGSTAYWYSTSVSNRTIYYYSDTNNPNPASPPTASNRGSSYPNMKFNMCPPYVPCSPKNILVSPEDVNATISWAGTADVFEVKVYTDTASSAIDLLDVADIYEEIISSNSVYLSHLLTENTNYAVYVRGICDDGNLISEWKSTNFKTTYPVATIPYFTDFENRSEDSDWHISSSSTNAWTIDTAVYSEGDRSMYISNDNVTYYYGVNNTSYSYAYKPFVLNSNEVYDFTFDWRANGEVNTDLLRVFLIPSNADITVGNSNGQTGSTNTTPAGWIDIGGYDAVNMLNLSNNWANVYREISIPKSGTYNLAFFWKNNNSGGSQQPAAIDNVSLSAQYCTPTQIMSTESNEGVDISWVGTANYYNVKIFTYTTGSSINPSQTGDAFDGQVPSYSTIAFKHFDAGELMENTRYIVYIQGVCDEGNSNWMRYQFKTDLNATPLSYETGFENNADNSKWVISSSGGANVWTFGSDVNNGGNQCMYVSNTQGATNTYNTGSISASYAYKVIDIRSSVLYEMAFDWKAQGESNVDYLRAFLIPENPENALKLERAITNDITATEIPEGWIPLDGGNKMNLSNGWRTRNIAFQATLQGRHFLAFLWKNNERGGTQSPAAIDNLVVRRVLCAPPTNLSVVPGGITQTTARVEWWNTAGTAAAYNVKLFTAGSDGDLTQPGNIADLPGFTNYEHTFTGLQPNTTYTLYVQSECSGTSGLSIWNSISFTTSIAVEPLPLLTNFSNNADNAKWAFSSNLNGDKGQNKFMIGTEANDDGNKLLYVSENENDYNYNLTSESSTYAYRMFNFRPGIQYYIAFDWKAQGEGTSDYLRAVLIPADSTNRAKIESGNSENVTNAALPTGWIAVDGGYKSMNDNWNSVGRQFTVTTNRDYYFAFVWKNNAALGTQPPAAIRNVSVSAPDTITRTATSCAGYEYSDQFITIPASQLATPGNYERITAYIDPATGVVTYQKLILTVKSGGAKTDNKDLCQGSSFDFYGREITTTGTYKHYFYGLNGCDSTITLNLTLAPAITVEKTINVDPSELPYTICGQTFNAIGVYSVVCTGKAVDGCDSITNIKLNITTDLDEIPIGQFGITPNPINVGGEVLINAEFTIQEQNGLKVEVVTAAGQNIKTFYPDTYPIKVGGFEVSGMYIIRVTTGDGVVRYGKVIVK